jgi:hypothetical protein
VGNQANLLRSERESSAEQLSAVKLLSEKNLQLERDLESAHEALEKMKELAVVREEQHIVLLKNKSKGQDRTWILHNLRIGSFRNRIPD